MEAEKTAYPIIPMHISCVGVHATIEPLINHLTHTSTMKHLLIKLIWFLEIVLLSNILHKDIYYYPTLEFIYESLY
jgi:hypothetical protein